MRDEISRAGVDCVESETSREREALWRDLAEQDACAGRAANPVPAAAGVRALAVVEAAAQAARLGTTVSL